MEDPSLKSDDDHDPPQEMKAPPKDLGPTFHTLKGWRRQWRIFRYTLQHQRCPIIIMAFFIAAVFLGSLYLNELHVPATVSNTPKSWIDWLINAQSILGVGTLLVAFFVWRGEIQEDWENDLPKRLSVFFFHEGNPLIVCRYVWLAGADEIRTWGQQVAMQAQPGLLDKTNPGKEKKEKLDFGLDVETKKPIPVLGPKGEVWMHYSVCFRLTKLNSNLDDYIVNHRGECIYQNLAANDMNPNDVLQEEVDTIPEVADWKAVVQLKFPKQSV
ncbi:MAG: hypothetical protein JW999_11480 [Methanotrichaceae archaeon]|nr:hypothetical protein [Methanotrichaceae archaeon]